MAHTFDIRFGRSVGLSSLFEAPENIFHWKGAGRLKIDANGISIGTRRGLFSLLPLSRRVAAADLKEVLREGEALRLEFATGESTRVVLPFWARNQDVAAKIVRLMPTTRTVEMEHDAAGVGRARFRLDWRAVSLLAVLLLGITSWLFLARSREEATINATLSAPAAAADRVTTVPVENAAESKPPQNAASVNAMQRPHSSTPARAVRFVVVQSTMEHPEPMELTPPDPYATDDAALAASPAPVAAPTGTTAVAPDQFVAPPPLVVYVEMVDGVVPIVPPMPAYDEARRQLDLFSSEVGSLDDAARIDSASWWNASVRIYNDRELDDPALWPLRDMELAVSRAWRDSIECGGVVGRCAPAREMAERLTQRLYLYVR